MTDEMVQRSVEHALAVAEAAAAGKGMMTESLAHALAVLQTRLPKIKKDRTADTGKYKYKYADLANVQEQLMPIMGQLGLSFSSKPTWVGRSELGADGSVRDVREFLLVYRLRHVSGEEDGGEYALPSPMTHTPQEVGSAITYARRYTLCCITGAVADEDDDGAAATRASSEQTEKAKPARAQRGKVADDGETAVAVQNIANEAFHLSEAFMSLNEAGQESQRETAIDTLRDVVFAKAKESQWLSQRCYSKYSGNLVTLSQAIGEAKSVIESGARPGNARQEGEGDGAHEVGSGEGY